MTRAAMLAQLDSRALTEYLALYKVREWERDQAEEEAKHARESGDGEVITYGKPRGPFDDEDDD